MLHTLGRRRPVEGLTTMLLECHGRIREFLALAVRAGAHQDTPASDVAVACQRVERYFEEALPLHVRDEEESLLPRLRGRSPAIDAALARMHGEHAAHGPLVDTLVARSQALRSAPGEAEARSALVLAARALEAAFEPHLREEEAVVFPAIDVHLSIEERDAVVRELRDRRR